ncbi:MAG: error-prone DNA polymerase [Myxococcaceae bacterium]|nr:error-prone DNA polymerase [Myxococcaceae bacterium]
MYAELVARSNFSFLRGASHPEELVAAAAHDGLSAIALADLDGLYGAVKAHLCAKDLGIRFLIASQITLTDAPPLVVYVQDADGYKNLCRLLSFSRLSNPKGQAGVSWRILAEHARGLCALIPFPPVEGGQAPEVFHDLSDAFRGRLYVGVTRTLCAGDEARVLASQALARELGVPLCAHNDVHTHTRARQKLQDVLTAIRHGVSVGQCGRRLFPNAERTLKGPAEMARLFDDLPEAVGRTLEIADGCRFSLDEIRYQFPEQDLPPGKDANAHLRDLTLKGLHFRYPNGIPEAVQKQVAHELDLIEKLDVAGYFLAIEDIVRFAREQGILCQGRGSAANSAVCYALQITAIDPVRMGLLFERFMSMERKEPPDIDVDFEHERREEVLQYVYQRHGRHQAGMVCEVICYRGKLALREVGKALGLSLDQVDRLSRALDGWMHEGVTPQMLVAAGLSPDDPRVRLTVQLAGELEGFPRHLSIHVGGFVITKDPLIDIVPIENAAMKDRTVVQWDKDDLSALNILKVDLLALGMLTAISKCLQLIRQHHGRDLSLATIPPEDPKVYEMLCNGDAIGVFQVESRAQINMLGRLKPRTFYDLVIEIAIIRPGPIIGDMVHPFLRRREGLEPVSYPSEEVRAILEKTLGVPLFQEQAMKLAMVAAGFTPAEADQLRRILSHKRAEELLIPYRSKFVEGCVRRGYPREFAESTFRQFKGFANYGFPESHSASFALIAYASAWLKCYYPAAFAAALLNSQPMGFYAPHTIVDDARRHGVTVRPVDVQHSDWDCTLEPSESSAGGVALRVGMRQVKGLREDTARRIEAARGEGFSSVADVARRSRVPRHELARLALAGAFRSLAAGRREALWELQALGPLEEDDLFFGIPLDGVEVELPPLGVAESLTADYETTGLSVDRHPLELLRPQLDARRAVTAAGLSKVPAGRRVSVGGMVICRQRPPTARGFTFLSLEDESGIANLVVEPDLFERYRQEVVSSIFLYAEGVVERAGRVVNLKVRRLEPLRYDGERRMGAPVPLGHR